MLTCFEKCFMNPEKLHFISYTFHRRFYFGAANRKSKLKLSVIFVRWSECEHTHQNTSRTGETRGQEQNWGSNCSRHHEDQLVGHAAFILKCKLHKNAHVFNFNVFFLYFLWHYFAFKMILYKVMIWCRI